jgi:hypothetical protein
MIMLFMGILPKEIKVGLNIANSQVILHTSLILISAQMDLYFILIAELMNYYSLI